MALLFRQAGADDDGRNGFQELPLTDLTLRVTESSHRGAPMTMMRAGEERDLAAIAAMGRVRAGPFRFHLDRDVDFIRYTITTRRPACRARVHELAPTAVLHRRRRHHCGGLRDRERRRRHMDARRMRQPGRDRCADRALLQALIAREPAERRPIIRTWLPPHFLPPQVTIASATPSIASIGVPMLGSGAMVPPLSTDDVLFWRNDVF